MVVALSLLIFTATATVISGLRSAPGAFAVGEGFVISDSTSPTIFSSRVDVDMVTVLEGVPEVTGVSPEVFAFSSFEGNAFVVRGVDIDRLNRTGPGFRELSLAEGESMAHTDSALVGDRLAGRLGKEPPYTVPLVGSYSSKMEFVEVIGEYSTGSPLDDEMIVSLDVARFLSGMRGDEVSIIRVSSDNPEWLAEVLSPANSRFTLFDLHTSKGEVAVGEPQSISVGVRNWGGATGTVTVRFSEGAVSLGESVVSLDPSKSTTVTVNLSSPQLGERSVAASISGDFPVTLYANFTVIEPYLKLSAPSQVLLGSVFNVTVTEYSGDPAEGAEVTFGTQSVYADRTGTASLTASSTGEWTVLATMPELIEASATVKVLDPSAFPAEFLPLIVDFTVLPEVVKESEPVAGVLAVTNSGSVGGHLLAEIFVDSQVYLTINVSVVGMSSEIVRFNISGLAPGAHTVQAGSFSRSVVVESWIVENPDIVQLVVRYGGYVKLTPSASISIYQAAKISEGNVSVALFAIGAVSALLAALSMASVYSMEIHESRHTLGVLRTVGASGREIRRLVFLQALESGLVGSVIGVTVGVLVAGSISSFGLLTLFGHTLALETDMQLLLTVLFASIAISVGTALWCSVGVTHASAILSVRGLEVDGDQTAVRELEDD